MRAIDLAKEIGGVAKTTSAWRTGMGVAMFATPEAANLFAHACRPALVSLAVELDRSGVRCLAPAAVHTPAPETGPSSISAEAIVRDPVEERTTEKTLSAAEPDLPPRPQPAGTQAQVPTSEAEAEEVDPQDAGQLPRKRSRLGPAIGGVLIIVAVLAVWLTKSLGHHGARPAKTQDYAAALKVPSLPPPEIPAPIAPAEVVPSPNEPPLPVVVPSSRVGSPPALPPPSSAKAHASARRSHAPKSGKMQKPAAAPPIQAISSPKPAAPHERPKPSAPRAGKLSNDDF
jgi:hypothetical protein